ncbi:MAG: GTPase domain-containing protein [Myxococcota bacterium]|nr:GTPase domain-containing protein [Myxococcota bacterium]
MTEGPPLLSLSLISHTNAGKTTLARTLLGRDVGDVLDQAHVTEESSRYVMLDLPAAEGAGGGGRIELWDTPGLGDSVRLLAELEGREDPLGWLSRQRFDRDVERPLWSSRKAVRNVVDHADVVLYLVNASEDPATAGYVEPEMKILGWIGCPVIVLLNQTGPPVDTDARRKAEERWRWHLASHAAVRDVLALDAFTRCWVQEGLLLLRLQALVPDGSAGLMAHLLEAWRDERGEVLAGAVAALAELVFEAARDAEPVAGGWVQRMGRRSAAAALARRLTVSAQRASDALITLYRLEGESAAWARGQLEDVLLPGQKPDPLRAGVVGGAVGGALGGLAADIASAGLSLGGGALAGALLGGLSLGGLAWAYEQLGGTQEPRVVWSNDYLSRLARQSLLRYLAVAHFGRGTGRYRERVEPDFWAPVVERALAAHDRTLKRVFGRARAGNDGARAELERTLDDAVRRCLVELYPGTERFLERPG